MQVHHTAACIPDLGLVVHGDLFVECTSMPFKHTHETLGADGRSDSDDSTDDDDAVSDDDQDDEDSDFDVVAGTGTCNHLDHDRGMHAG